jgi:NCAIR mutase (PurE)-related protein
MRELLEAVAAGELSPEAAEAELRGYASVDAGRFDAARERRRGVPEAILGDGKTPEEIATLAVTAVTTTGRAIVTRVDEQGVRAVRERLEEDHPNAVIDRNERARSLVVHGPDYDRAQLETTVGIVTGGTADAAAAGEAAVIVREVGASVERIEDVGVAGIARLLDRLDRVRSADVLIVAAGREGALPTVVAGLVDVPVIGLPVSSGY